MKNILLKNLWVAMLLLAVGCAEKKRPAAPPPPPPPPPQQQAEVKPLKSQMPGASAELISHCVVVKQENANTVTCACIPAKTTIDSQTGKKGLICEKMKLER